MKYYLIGQDSTGKIKLVGEYPSFQEAEAAFWGNTEEWAIWDAVCTLYDGCYHVCPNWHYGVNYPAISEELVSKE